MLWTEAQWQANWKQSLQETMTKEIDRNGGTPADWRVSGKATKANPHKEDATWWKLNGSDFAKTYAEWRLANPQYELWVTPDGTLGNELDILVDFGTVPVRAIVDRVFKIGDALIVVDLKSGAGMPEDIMQLLIYAAAIDLRYGVRPELGAYFNARKGGLVATEPLDEFPTMDMVELIEDFNAQRATETYLPNPGRQCTWCEMRTHCKWGRTLATTLKARL